MKYTKKMLGIALSFMFVMAGAFAYCAVTGEKYVVDNVAAGSTPTQNITEMIEGLVPSFILLVFVMVFMIMLLTIVDRIGKR